MSTTNSMNRRNWLKTTALFTGGLTMLPPALNRLRAAPVAPIASNNTAYANDFAIGPKFPENLKARLFANENPFGPSPSAKKAIMDSILTSYQYPIRLIPELEEKICTHEGITADMLMISSGSSPLLLGTAVSLLKDGGNVVTAETTYDDLPNRCEKVNAKWIKVPLTKDYTHDLDAMEKAITPETKLVYICNPNNPTGTIVDKDKLKAFCERVSQKVTVFVDEAYIDYLPDADDTTLMSSVKKGQNLIVARTFSKVYGLAGLRIGYIVAQPATIAKLQPHTACSWAVLSVPAISGALASYQDKPYIQEVVKKTMESKQFLYDTLKAEGYSYIPSHTNFVMFPLKMDGERFAGEMMKRGVGLRNWKMNDQHWCRISIGRMDEMQAFAAAFKELS
jgi:histidinol-phosphate aminotransferase